MRRLDDLRRRAPDIRRLVESRNGANPRVFGSVARGDDRPGSDIDILIDATERLSLFDIGAMIVGVERMTGGRVDILTIDSIPEGKRARILAEARAL